jgi:NADPH2:quinone reductase
MASTGPKRELARQLGADKVVDSTSPTLAADLAEASGGAAAALEMTGGATLHATLAALAPFGRMAVFGGTSGLETTVGVRDLMAAGKTVTGFWLPLLYTRRGVLRESMDALFAAVRDQDLTVPTPAVYPLEDAARAHTDIAARRTTGKVVLAVSA